VVRDVKLQRRDLAVAAWASYKTRGGVRDVYVPIEITHAKIAAAAGRVPQITLLPGRHLSEVYLSVESLNADLTPANTLLKEAPVGEFSYPGGVPITLPLARLKIVTSGFYSVKIGATVKNGLPATLPIILYYARS
jgi:hypothetical protein